MDLITGKAQESFIEYHYNQLDFTKESHEEQYELFEFQTEEIHQFASIIDWLDSVGIYVQLEVCDSCISYSIKDFRSTILYDCYIGFGTRHQATQEAIKKAVEVFNAK